MRFMAIASVVCASRLIEPKLIAPVAKRLTIASAGSTSSSGTGLSADLELHQPADGQQALALLVDLRGKGPVLARAVAAHRMLQLRDRIRRPGMILAAHAEGIVAADIEHVPVDRIVAVGVAGGAARIPRRSRASPRLRSWSRCR